MSQYLLVIIAVSLCTETFAMLDPPVVACISLDEDGNVVLAWSAPADSNSEFTEFQIFYRPDDQTGFSEIQQVTSYTQQSVQIIGPFSGGEFYMTTVSNGGIDVSSISNIVKPITIELQADHRVVTISWDNVNLATDDSIYHVYRSIDNSGWEKIAQTEWDQTSTKNTVNQCSAKVKYRVEVNGLGGCRSISNVDSISIFDNQPPLINSLLCASVDTTTGHVLIEWSRSASTDLFGYQINFFDDMISTDTVFGPDSTEAVFNKGGIDGLSQSETLSIAPFDSCFDSVTTMWYNQAADSLRFTTLFFDTLGFNRCDGKIGLKWNMPAENRPVGVLNLSSFNIYRKDGSEDMRVIASLSSSDSIFLDSGLIKGERYQYMVSAVDQMLGKEAFGNTFTFTIEAPKRPKVLYIESIVNNHTTSRNEINILTDTTSESTRYGLFRGLNFFGSYQQVANSKTTDESNFSIVDKSGLADQSDFYYQVQAYDVCDDSMAISLPAKSIYINGFKNEQDFVNELRWTDYLGFENADSEVGEYQLIRLTNEMSLDTILKSKNIFQNNDTIYDLNRVGGEVCYFVQAIEVGQNQFKVQGASRSNLHCESFAPKVFIPNSFTPDSDGINDVWLPNVNFVEVDGYSLSIFDRAGKLVHATANPDEGWDGENHPIGVYPYFLKLQNSRGEAVNFTGNISLVK